MKHNCKSSECHIYFISNSDRHNTYENEPKLLHEGQNNFFGLISLDACTLVENPSMESIHFSLSAVSSNHLWLQITHGGSSSDSVNALEGLTHIEVFDSTLCNVCFFSLSSSAGFRA